MKYPSEVSAPLREAHLAKSPGLTVAHIVEGCEGGVGTAVKQLITSQSKDEAIAGIHLLADPGRMGDMLLDAAATRHDYKSTRNPLAFARVSRSIQLQLEAINPDVVYLHSTFPGVYGRMLHFQHRSRWATVYCAHGWAFTQAVSPARKLFYSMVEKVLARRTDALVSISFAEYEAAVAAGIQVPLHRVIYHGTDPRKAGPRPDVQLARTGLNIAFVGRFDRQKGLDLLLEAFQDVRLQAITLWIIGVSTLGDGVQTIPDQSNIKHLGWVGNKDIDAYISCFDAVVMPSRWEGFGLVALETMRNAKPVIASRIGGLAELVIDGVNGRVFESESVSALKNVLLELSAPELERMGKMAGQIFESRFQADRCYDSWRTITGDALAASRQVMAANLRTPDKDSLVPAVSTREAL